MSVKPSAGFCMRTSMRVIFTFLTMAAFVSGVAAQTDHKIADVPFAPGEVLSYEAKVSKSLFRGIAVADLTFRVVSGRENGFLIKADAASKGTLLKLFRYSFLQRVESTIAPDSFRIEKTAKHDIQKDRVRDSEAVFDYERRRVTYTETDPREPMRPPRRIASEIDNPTQDLVSGIYKIRLMPLAVGSTFRIKVSDSGLTYEIPVRVTGREKQKSVLGTVNCFRIEPDIFGAGRLIEKEGSMIIWITDDARRIPVRSQVNASVGKIEIKLRSAKGIR